MTAKSEQPGESGVGAPPWSASGFWMIEFGIVALVLGRTAVLVALHLSVDSRGAEYSVLPVFLIPVLLAAVAFGVAGSGWSSGLTTVLLIPELSLAASAHRWSAVGVRAVQLLILAGAGIVVGQRVTAERRARTEREAHASSIATAEQRYRELFTSNRSPILIVGADGRVVESNPAAAEAFGPNIAMPTPKRLVDVIGADAASVVLTRMIDSDSAEPASAMPVETRRGRREFRISATAVGDPTGTPRALQVVFEDVTDPVRRSREVEQYADRMLAAQEDERRHLARELHDGPLQTLIHALRELDREQRVAPDARPELHHDVAASLASSVDEIRAIARGLRPSILDDLGLDAALRQLVEEAAARDGPACQLHGTLERRIGRDAELALFRITQEALNNAVKHAGATLVSVDISQDARCTMIAVSDDGRGFDPSTEIGHGSFGVTGMAERARSIGADVAVRSEPGGGTTVTALLFE